MTLDYLHDPNLVEPDGQMDLERECRDAIKGLEDELAAVRDELSSTHFERETAFAEIKRLQTALTKEVSELEDRMLSELAAIRAERDEAKDLVGFWVLACQDKEQERQEEEVRRLESAAELSALRRRTNADKITEYADLLARRDGNDQCSIYELAQWIETGKGDEWLTEAAQ